MRQRVEDLKRFKSDFGSNLGGLNQILEPIIWNVGSLVEFRCLGILSIYLRICKRFLCFFMSSKWGRVKVIYRDKISVYLQRHPRAGKDTHLTSTQELVKIHNTCEDILI